MNTIAKGISAIIYFHIKTLKDIKRKLPQIFKDKDDAVLTTGYFIVYFGVIGFLFHLAVSRGDIPMEYLIPITVLSVLISLIFIVLEITYYESEEDKIDILSSIFGHPKVIVVKKDDVTKYLSGMYLTLIIYVVIIFGILSIETNNALIVYTVFLVISHFISFVIYLISIMILYPLYEIFKSIILTLGNYFKKQ